MARLSWKVFFDWFMLLLLMMTLISWFRRVIGLRSVVIVL